jgi:hypothetical protein
MKKHEQIGKSENQKKHIKRFATLLSTRVQGGVIVKGIGHPLTEKGKCHHDEKGDIERERTETVVGLQ